MREGDPSGHTLFVASQTFSIFAQQEQRVGDRDGAGDPEDQAHPEISHDDRDDEQCEGNDNGDSDIGRGNRVAGHDDACRPDHPQPQAGTPSCSKIVATEPARPLSTKRRH